MQCKAEELRRPPRTRAGGVFIDPETIQLHGNDFSWDEKMGELSDQERKLVDEYLSLYEQQLLDLDGKEVGILLTGFVCENNSWEAHYRVNKRHFPLKNYISLAFPLFGSICATQKQTECRYVLECGCGTGSTLLPLMRQFKNNIHYVGFDISDNAVSVFLNHPISKEFIERQCLTAFTYDILSSRERNTDEPDKVRCRTECGALRSAILKRIPNCGKGVDVVFLVFVLSSLPSLKSVVYALKEIASVLKVDGVLFFRDYALPDHNFFRFVEQNNTKANSLSFCKGDGTLQMFFDVNITRRLFAMAGFEEIDGHGLQYHCNRIVNRKNGKRMDKVFINGRDRKSVV